MSTLTTALEKPARKPAPAANTFPVATLQRKCACGGTATSTDGECQECKKTKLQRRAADFSEPGAAPPIVDEVLESPGQPLDAATRSFMEPRFGHDFSKVRVHTDHKAAESARAVNALAYTVGGNVVFGGGQYAPGRTAGRRLLAHELTHVVQQRAMRNAAPQAKLEVGPINDSQEQEADRFAEQVAGVSDAASMPPPNPGTGRQPRVQRAVDDQAPATVPPAAGPIVDDEAQQLGPGQMRKTEFLDSLRTHVCSVADSVLVSVGRTSQGCPLVERWIGHLRQRNAQYIERGLRRYASPAPQANAQDYIVAVGERVREGVTRWASTGDISDVPPELMSEMAGGGILGAIGGAVAGIGSAIGSAVSGIGKLFAKAKDGGVGQADPLAVQTRLGAGAPLEGGVKARMEGAFGHNFANVRVHADSSAAALSASLNARAFTIGDNVAFAAGEYQPSTLIGDALIAHELAHVVQQGGASSRAAMSGGATEYHSLESDADQSALGVMLSLVTGTKTALKEIPSNGAPRLRSGLKLQRCGGENAAAQGPTLATSPALRKSWEAALLEGVALLKAAASKGASCKFPKSGDPGTWAYNSNSWKKVTGGEEIRKYQVAYVPTKLPHESVDDLFDRLDLWECGCALFSELPWLYAWRHTLPIAEFDKKFKDLALRPQESTGLERETHKVENVELEKEQGKVGYSDEMWRDAPVGTKVIWQNESRFADGTSWKTENAIRTFKGPSDDSHRYVAHPLGFDLSEEEVKRGLAENAFDFPFKYTVTGSTLQQLRAAGAPESFVTSLQSLQGQTFVGGPAFLTQVRPPALALRLKHDDFNELLNNVYKFSKTKASDADAKDYVDKNITRHEIQLPK